MLSNGTFYNYVDASTYETLTAGYFVRVEKSYGVSVFVFIDNIGNLNKIHITDVNGGRKGFFESYDN